MRQDKIKPLITLSTLLLGAALPACDGESLDDELLEQDPADQIEEVEYISGVPDEEAAHSEETPEGVRAPAAPIHLTPLTEGIDEIESPTADAKPRLNDGTSTTDFTPVVRIESSANTTCTATAIADDLLVTAAHCLKSGDNVFDWIKVREGNGDNDDAEGKYSSHFIMSEDIYDNYTIEDSAYSDYYSRDIAFVKFGKGTFASTYPLGSIANNSDLNGDDVILIGFGGNDTKHYGAETVTSVVTYSGNTDYKYATTDNKNSIANVESGDSGGPMLRASGDSYEVVGVLYGHSDTSSSHAVITDHVNDHVSPVIGDGLDDYCAETFQHADFDGWGMSFCHTSRIDAIFSADSDFSDTYKIESHYKFSKWNNELSSLLMPNADMIITFYKDSDWTDDAVTFNNIMPWGASSSASYFGDYGMNDKISSMSMYSTSSGLSKSWHIRGAEHGKCFDTGGSTAEETDIEQRDCNEDDDDQLFEFVEEGSYHMIEHVASGMCLHRSSTTLQLRSCDTSKNRQLFTFADNTSSDASNDFQIRNRGGGNCVTASSSDDGGKTFTIETCDSSEGRQDFALLYL
ncbi:ricin-type beta-trefoil lectin domain protein [Pseudenhygromyxa sp. WMMC2535]|uniref:ricin-type beta-trefoil lectin domain protein n=1 Tax=Pseudenhygromyxa sp. WMMC2535 TaxID=2712867 RepID=UPI001554C365|nr:ricin-type beta-trefoil lectin domain protein [Pseudenhygromyxa sp. WMMC2535]NVB37318.1 ricin-type beta-trefoil lectin domain protein [Pseudenhygromyxa sp. WMMC2535]